MKFLWLVASEEELVQIGRPAETWDLDNRVDEQGLDELVQAPGGTPASQQSATTWSVRTRPARAARAATSGK